MLYNIEGVLFWGSGEGAYRLMHTYAKGTHGYPQSPVMAYSWALVVQEWYEDEAEDPDVIEAAQLANTLAPSLTEEERHAAITLAQEVFTISRVYLAPFEAALTRRARADEPDRADGLGGVYGP